MRNGQLYKLIRLNIIYMILLDNFGQWWARRDSNPQPSGYEPPALTIELQARPEVPAVAGQWYPGAGFALAQILHILK